MAVATRTRAPLRSTATRQITDAAALEAELRRAIRGEVRFDAGTRALYSTDASNYRQVPIAPVPTCKPARRWQPFWAARLHQLAVAPTRLPQRNPTADA